MKLIVIILLSIFQASVLFAQDAKSDIHKGNKLYQQKKYAEGWAARQFKERFGVWPRGLSAHIAAPDVTCRNWVKASMIRFAKGREKQRAA